MACFVECLARSLSGARPVQIFCTLVQASW